MTNRFGFLTIYLIIIVSLVHSAHHPWSWLNPIPTDNGLTDCYAIDSNTLIIVDYENPFIYKTTDGGLTWATKYVPYPDSENSYYRFVAVDFPTNNIGYVGGVMSSRGIVLKTTDQGENWVYKYLGISGQGGILDIDFPQGNPDVGYAVGSKSRILKTTDGGETWIQQMNPGAEYQDLRAVHFPENADVGYAVGGLNTYDTLYPLILKTTDGGQNWVAQTSPVDGGYHGVFFCNNNLGYACGGGEGYGGVNPKGYVIKTTNGGATWQLIYNKPNEKIKGIHFLTPSLGFIYVIIRMGGGYYSSYMRRTTNGGATWDSIISPERCSHYYKFSFSFPSAQIGYGVGSEYDINFNHGRIFKTTNGGTTWFSIKKGVTLANRYAVDFPETDQVGYVVGDSGCILKTSDGGLNWTRQFTGTGERFRDVDFVNNQTGFAVGDNGTFFKTTDGGNTWIPKNSTTMARLYAVKFVNPQIGYIAGWQMDSGGMILKTTNGGDTWIRQTIPNNNPERAIQDLFFFNADTGYAVSGIPEEWAGADIGRVYKTTNGGQNWFVNYTPPGSLAKDLYAIDFPVNSQVGYIGGRIENQQVYKIKFLKTTDGGSSWQPITLNVDNSISAIWAISFRDNFVGYAAPWRSEYNNIYKTTDGGATWMRHLVPTRHLIYDLCAIRNTDIVYAVGAGGMILKTTNGGSVWIAEDKGDENTKVDNYQQRLWVYPNPFSEKTEIRCQMPDTRYQILHHPSSHISYFPSATLKIYDVSGHLVKSFNHLTNYPPNRVADGGNSPFNHLTNYQSSVIWDGCDDLGRNLPAGVYFIVLKDKSFSSVRVVKIK